MRDEKQKITRHEPGVTGGRETVTILNGARFRDCGISPKIVVSCGIEIAYIGTCILSFLIKKNVNLQIPRRGSDSNSLLCGLKSEQKTSNFAYHPQKHLCATLISLISIFLMIRQPICDELGKNPTRFT